MLKSILSVSGLGLLVQLLGFAKLLVVAKFYGAGPALDAYYLALILPALLLGFVGGGLQSSFMPIYGELRAGGRVREAARLQSQIFVWLLLVLLAVAGLVALYSDFFIALSQFSGKSDPLVLQAANSALVVLIFSFVLNALLDYWGLVINSHGRFVAVALAPMVNIVISTGAILLVADPGVNELVWGLVAGLLAQMLLLWLVAGGAVPLLLVSGSCGGRAMGCLDAGGAEMRRVLSLFLPALIGVAVTNTNFAIDQAMASGVGAGGLSILNYASRFHNVLVQSGIMAVSVVLLPRFIVLVTEHQYSKLFSMLRRLLLLSVLLGLLLLAAVGLLGEWFLMFLLGFTALSVANINEIHTVWFCYTAGMFATAMCVFYIKLFQAWQRPGFISVVAVVSLALNVLLNWLLIPSFGVAGIAVATSLVYPFSLLIYVVAARRIRRREMRLLLS